MEDGSPEKINREKMVESQESLSIGLAEFGLNSQQTDTQVTEFAVDENDDEDDEDEDDEYDEGDEAELDYKAVKSLRDCETDEEYKAHFDTKCGTSGKNFLKGFIKDKTNLLATIPTADQSAFVAKLNEIRKNDATSTEVKFFLKLISKLEKNRIEDTDLFKNNLRQMIEIFDEYKNTYVNDELNTTNTLIKLANDRLLAIFIEEAKNKYESWTSSNITPVKPASAKKRRID